MRIAACGIFTVAEWKCESDLVVLPHRGDRQCDHEYLLFGENQSGGHQ